MPAPRLALKLARYRAKFGPDFLCVSKRASIVDHVLQAMGSMLLPVTSAIWHTRPLFKHSMRNRFQFPRYGLPAYSMRFFAILIWRLGFPRSLRLWSDVLR